jgi:hypothetical protein
MAENISRGAVAMSIGRSCRDKAAAAFAGAADHTNAAQNVGWGGSLSDDPNVSNVSALLDVTSWEHSPFTRKAP